MKWILPEALWDFMKEMCRMESPTKEAIIIRWAFCLFLSSLCAVGAIAAWVWLFRFLTV